MKLTTRAEYGIRVLVALARAGDDDRPVPLATVARVEKLPHAYLEQLVRDLRAAGLVTATRGKAGGYRLGRAAEQISLVEAVRALDGPLLEMPCAGAENLEACDRPQDCSVHLVFQRIFDSLQGTLGAMTLAEAALAAGGPPYPPVVRRKRAADHARRGAEHAALAAAQVATTADSTEEARV